MNKSRSVKIAAIVAAVSLAVIPAASATTWKAGGASSVNGLMTACAAAYQKATGDDFPYNGTGSGAGKTGLHNGSFDFAFSDSVDTAPMAGEIHLPAFVWPVGFLQNIGGSNLPLTLSTTTLAKIFAGQITMWNDPAIVADNNRSVTTIIYKKVNGVVAKDAKGAPIVLRTGITRINRTLPAKPITVFYRNAGSGTSNNLTRAFNKLAPSIWTNPANDLFSTAFPGNVAENPAAFRAVSGSAGIAQGVQQTPYSIGYAEINFAAAPYNLKLVNVINPAGNAITPSSDSAMAAAALATVAADGTVAFNYTSTDNDQYPFTATTYALASTKDAKAAAIGKTLDYLATNCAKDNPTLGFATLVPTNAFAKAFASQVAKLK